MGLYHSTAIILKTRNLGEADRVLLLLSEEYGKFEAVVKGARRPRSRFIGNTLPFNLVKAMFFTGKNLDQLSQAELTHSFVSIREDLIKLAYASYWVELIDEFLPEREPAPEIFRFFLAVLITLDKFNHPQLLNLAFQTRLLNYLGYQPEIENCVNCSAEPGKRTGETLYFSSQAGGMLCASCQKLYPDSEPISISDIYFLHQLESIDIRELNSVMVDEKTIINTSKILRQFIEFRLDHPLKSQVFLDDVLS